MALMVRWCLLTGHSAFCCFDELRDSLKMWFNTPYYMKRLQGGQLPKHTEPMSSTSWLPGWSAGQKKAPTLEAGTGFMWVHQVPLHGFELIGFVWIWVKIFESQGLIPMICWCWSTWRTFLKRFVGGMGCRSLPTKLVWGQNDHGGKLKSLLLLLLLLLSTTY